MITKISLQNLGTLNKNRVVITTDRAEFILYFSYETLVGIDYSFTLDYLPRKRAVVENLWSTTTGKLLNELEPDHKSRLSSSKFDEEVSEMMKYINS